MKIVIDKRMKENTIRARSTPAMHSPMIPMIYPAFARLLSCLLPLPVTIAMMPRITATTRDTVNEKISDNSPRTKTDVPLSFWLFCIS